MQNASLNISDLNQCCGCSACSFVCKHDAITMQKDALGFLYPVIDKNKCVSCGRCISVCSFNDNYAKQLDFNTPLVFGARSINSEDLILSQTAGAAYLIAKKVIWDGGIVYGAAIINPRCVSHIRVDSIKDLQLLRGSKYIQSNIVGILPNVIDDLRNERLVLFIGTPCQVAAVKSFIPRHLQELFICVDLICHGVSSPKLWADHLDDIEKREKSEIVSVNFRDKKFGWEVTRVSLKLTNGRILYPESFTLMKDFAIRPSCGNCHFTNTQRVGDITIGDFWGWGKLKHQWSDGKPVNLILVNSHKGNNLLSGVRDLQIIQETLNNCIQPHLKSPIEFGPDKRLFHERFSQKGYKYVQRKYGDRNIKYMLLRVYLKCKLYRVKESIVRR